MPVKFPFLAVRSFSHAPILLRYQGEWRSRGRKTAGTYAGTSEKYMLNSHGPDENCDPMEWIRLAYKYERPADHPFTHPIAVFHELAERMPANAVCCIDTGDCTLFWSIGARITKQQRTLVDSKPQLLHVHYSFVSLTQCWYATVAMGTMGYSLPAAIAAAMHDPNCIPIVIVGDGALQMTLGELGTMQQNLAGRKILIVVATNGLLGRVHFGWEGVAGTRVGIPKLQPLSAAFGGTYNLIASTERSTIAKAVDEALNAKGLHIMEMLVDDFNAAPMVGL